MFFSPDEALRVVRHIHGPDATAQAFAGELWFEEFDGTYRVPVPKGQGCPFLDEGKCTVHAIRPEQCRTYPFWPEILTSPRDWKAESKYCEGISGEGDHYDLMRIAKILNGRATNE